MPTAGSDCGSLPPALPSAEGDREPEAGMGVKTGGRPRRVSYFPPSYSMRLAR